MAQKYMDIVATPSVRRAEMEYYGRALDTSGAPEKDLLGEDELQFIAARDSFYIGTVSETGWPYIQHRGGQRGFLKVLGPNSLGFADYKGNRQLISTGNAALNDRVSMFLMDYPNRTRLKLIGHAQVVDARSNSKLVSEVSGVDDRRLVERVFLIDVLSFDWNCQQHIMPRFDAAEVADLVRPLRERIAELEAKLRKASKD